MIATTGEPDYIQLREPQRSLGRRAHRWKPAALGHAVGWRRGKDSARMKVLLAASEVTGFAKTGGLADFAASLPQALARRGYECAIVLPLYRGARSASIPLEPTDHTFQVPVGRRTITGRIWRSSLGGSSSPAGTTPEVPVYLIEQAEYFDRDSARPGRGLYQFTLPSGQRADYPDNCERFVFLCRSVFEVIRLLDFWPDVLHANDWQTGLVPVYLREVYGRPPAGGPRPRPGSGGYGAIRTLVTLHNLAYQGLFWHWDMLLTGLDWRLFNHQHLEFYGQLSFLKAGIVFADLLNTVSPTYAREIQTPYFGCGLQGVLSERAKDLYGIVNGVDYSVWDPPTDPILAQNYNIESVALGKPVCKAALQQLFYLAAEPKTLLFGMVARLVEQKGVELVIRAADKLLGEGAQLIVLGEGDLAYHRQLSGLRDRFPDRMGLRLGFEEALAHRIEAGADVFLMPSLYEPSGLNQLYSMRYGTVPVVRATGGLADTVVDCTPEALAADRATGFTFVAYNPEGLLTAVHRAWQLFRQPEQWLRVVRAGMRQDWSWDRSAAEYEQLYQRVTTDR
jgi:starch synthase